MVIFIVIRCFENISKYYAPIYISAATEEKWLFSFGDTQHMVQIRGYKIRLNVENNDWSRVKCTVTSFWVRGRWKKPILALLLFPAVNSFVCETLGNQRTTAPFSLRVIFVPKTGVDDPLERSLQTTILYLFSTVQKRLFCIGSQTRAIILRKRTEIS